MFWAKILDLFTDYIYNNPSITIWNIGKEDEEYENFNKGQICLKAYAWYSR